MTVICLCIFLLSTGGIIACLISTNAHHHARPLAALSEEDLKPGKYVSGTITAYVVSPHQSKDKGDVELFGTWGVWNRFDGEYFRYIIPFHEDQYVYIWIKDQESLALLKESSDGLHVNVPFVGRISAEEAPPQYTDEQLGFDHNKVVTNPVIVQKTLHAEAFWMKACLLGILIFFLLYRWKGRIEVSEAVREDKAPQVIARYADVSAEMASVERRLGTYDKLEKEYRRGGLVGAACVGMGGFAFVRFGNFTALMMLILSMWYGDRNL